MNSQNKRLMFILLAVPILLLIPLIAMQFSTSIDWDVSDFAIMGILLLGTGLLCELVLRKVNSLKSKILLCCAVLLIFLFIWAELAIGILG